MIFVFYLHRRFKKIQGKMFYLENPILRYFFTAFVFLQSLFQPL